MGFPQAIPYSFDSIDAGQNQPVVRGKILHGGVQRFVGTRRANLNEWNLDDLGAEFAEAGGKCVGLMAGTADQNAKTAERSMISQAISPLKIKRLTQRAQRTAAEFAEKSYGGCGRAIASL